MGPLPVAATYLSTQWTPCTGARVACLAFPAQRLALAGAPLAALAFPFNK